MSRDNLFLMCFRENDAIFFYNRGVLVGLSLHGCNYMIRDVVSLIISDGKSPEASFS